MVSEAVSTLHLRLIRIPVATPAKAIKIDIDDEPSTNVQKSKKLSDKNGLIWKRNTGSATVRGR